MHESPYFYIDENGKKRRKPAENFRRWVIVIGSILFCTALAGFCALAVNFMLHIRFSPRGTVQRPAGNQSAPRIIPEQSHP
jgi:hypothetical protein